MRAILPLENPLRHGKVCHNHAAHHILEKLEQPMATTVHSIFTDPVQKAESWVNDLMDELNMHDPHRAWSILRGVLQALRDRLTPDEAVKLAAQMPEVIRGMYYEGWKLHDKPIRMRHRQDFFDRVMHHSRIQIGTELEPSVRGVFHLLSKRISEGEITDIVRTMPEELRELWP
jgi:uncharacterized protein (DUF2267 family)